ncbi:hypothetical protein Tco_0656879 [Tanacetum coccineum]|uniref:Uncharacterized protein n=1 Tax=Tanacetum coccineum TaxID=301880 RepID=A0ABQ4XB50_9ASTR
MYKVVTTHESQTNETKHGLSSTGMNGASSVRRPMNRDSHVKNSVLANSKKSAKKVAVYVRNNKQTDNTSENVISNKENVIDVDVANASKCQNGFTKDEIFMAMTFDYNRSSLEPQCQMTLVRSSSSLGRQCQMVSAKNNTSGPVPQCLNDVCSQQFRPRSSYKMTSVITV